MLVVDLVQPTSALIPAAAPSKARLGNQECGDVPVYRLVLLVDGGRGYVTPPSTCPRRTQGALASLVVSKSSAGWIDGARLERGLPMPRALVAAATPAAERYVWVTERCWGRETIARILNQQLAAKNAAEPANHPPCPAPRNASTAPFRSGRRELIAACGMALVATTGLLLMQTRGVAAQDTGPVHRPLPATAALSQLHYESRGPQRDQSYTMYNPGGSGAAPPFGLDMDAASDTP